MKSFDPGDMVTQLSLRSVPSRAVCRGGKCTVNLCLSESKDNIFKSYLNKSSLKLN